MAYSYEVPSQNTYLFVKPKIMSPTNDTETVTRKERETNRLTTYNKNTSTSSNTTITLPNTTNTEIIYTDHPLTQQIDTKTTNENVYTIPRVIRTTTLVEQSSVSQQQMNTNQNTTVANEKSRETSRSMNYENETTTQNIHSLTNNTNKSFTTIEEQNMVDPKLKTNSPTTDIRQSSSSTKTEPVISQMIPITTSKRKTTSKQINSTRHSLLQETESNITKENVSTTQSTIPNATSLDSIYATSQKSNSVQYSTTGNEELISLLGRVHSINETKTQPIQSSKSEINKTTISNMLNKTVSQEALVGPKEEINALVIPEKELLSLTLSNRNTSEPITQFVFTTTPIPVVHTTLPATTAPTPISIPITVATFSHNITALDTITIPDTTDTPVGNTNSIPTVLDNLVSTSSETVATDITTSKIPVDQKIEIQTIKENASTIIKKIRTTPLIDPPSTHPQKINTTENATKVSKMSEYELTKFTTTTNEEITFSQKGKTHIPITQVRPSSLLTQTKQNISPIISMRNKPTLTIPNITTAQGIDTKYIVTEESEIKTTEKNVSITQREIPTTFSEPSYEVLHKNNITENITMTKQIPIEPTKSVNFTNETTTQYIRSSTDEEKESIIPNIRTKNINTETLINVTEQIDELTTSAKQSSLLKQITTNTSERISFFNTTSLITNTTTPNLVYSTSLHTPFTQESSTEYPKTEQTENIEETIPTIKKTDTYTTDIKHPTTTQTKVNTPESTNFQNETLIETSTNMVYTNTSRTESIHSSTEKTDTSTTSNETTISEELKIIKEQTENTQIPITQKDNRSTTDIQQRLVTNEKPYMDDETNHTTPEISTRKSAEDLLNQTMDIQNMKEHSFVIRKEISTTTHVNTPSISKPNSTIYETTSKLIMNNLQNTILPTSSVDPIYGTQPSINKLEESPFLKMQNIPYDKGIMKEPITTEHMSTTQQVSTHMDDSNQSLLSQGPINSNPSAKVSTTPFRTNIKQKEKDTTKNVLYEPKETKTLQENVPTTQGTTSKETHMKESSLTQPNTHISKSNGLTNRMSTHTLTSTSNANITTMKPNKFSTMPNKSNIDINEMVITEQQANHIRRSTPKLQTSKPSIEVKTVTSNTFITNHSSYKTSSQNDSFEKVSSLNIAFTKETPMPIKSIPNIQVIEVSNNTYIQKNVTNPIKASIGSTIITHSDSSESPATTSSSSSDTIMKSKNTTTTHVKPMLNSQSLDTPMYNSTRSPTLTKYISIEKWNSFGKSSNRSSSSYPVITEPTISTTPIKTNHTMTHLISTNSTINNLSNNLNNDRFSSTKRNDIIDHGAATVPITSEPISNPEQSETTIETTYENSKSHEAKHTTLSTPFMSSNAIYSTQGFNKLPFIPFTSTPTAVSNKTNEHTTYWLSEIPLLHTLTRNTKNDRNSRTNSNPDRNAISSKVNYVVSTKKTKIILDWNIRKDPMTYKTETGKIKSTTPFYTSSVHSNLNSEIINSIFDDNTQGGNTKLLKEKRVTTINSNDGEYTEKIETITFPEFEQKEISKTTKEAGFIENTTKAQKKKNYETSKKPHSKTNTMDVTTPPKEIVTPTTLYQIIKNNEVRSQRKLIKNQVENDRTNSQTENILNKQENNVKAMYMKQSTHYSFQKASTNLANTLNSKNTQALQSRLSSVFDVYWILTITFIIVTSFVVYGFMRRKSLNNKIRHPTFLIVQPHLRKDRNGRLRTSFINIDNISSNSDLDSEIESSNNSISDSDSNIDELSDSRTNSFSSNDSLKFLH